MENHAERTPKQPWERAPGTNFTQENISATSLQLPLTMTVMPFLHLTVWSAYLWKPESARINPSCILSLKNCKCPPAGACYLHDGKLKLGSVTNFAITLYNHNFGGICKWFPDMSLASLKGETLNILSPCHAAGNCTRQSLRVPALLWPPGNQWETREWGQNVMMEHNQYQWKVCMGPFQIGGQYPDVFLIMFTEFLRLEASSRMEMFSCFQDDIF